MVAMTDLISTKKVVVFTPPAVELGDPPMNINTMIMMIEAKAILFTSSTIKPDVRHVTIWNMEVKILSKRVVCEPNVRLRSMKKKRMEPMAIIQKVVISTTLVCGIRLFQWYLFRSFI